MWGNGEEYSIVLLLSGLKLMMFGKGRAEFWHGIYIDSINKSHYYLFVKVKHIPGCNKLECTF